MGLILVCPECLEELKYTFNDDPDHIICPHCNKASELDWVGCFFNSQYFLVRREK